MWYKFQFGITILMGLVLILAFFGSLFLYSSHKGFLSADNPLVSFFILLLVPLSLVLLACFIFSSGLIISSVGKYLFSGQLGDATKKYFLVHSIYELSYILFFLFTIFFNAGKSIE